MSNLEEEFLSELEPFIKSRRNLEIMHNILHVVLMVTLAACGFLTAAASQDSMKLSWVSTPTSLLIYGLLSALCAITNQVVKPAEKNAFYRNAKKPLQYIRGEIKFRGMSASEAELLRAIAVVQPEIILGKLQTISKAIARRNKAFSRTIFLCTNMIKIPPIT